MSDFSDSNFPAVSEGTIGEATVQTVNARDLHAFLGVGRDFATWIKDRISAYEFAEGADYVTTQDLRPPVSGSAKSRAQVATEYAVTLDMAKELGMVERNEQGRRVRAYFIECERRAKGATVHFLVPKSLPEALRLAADQAERIEAQKAKIAALQPKAEFHDTVSEAINCQTVEEVAKILGTGQNRMFAWLREQAILMTSNRPYQRFIDEGYFRVVEKAYKDGRGEAHTYTRTLVTGKGLAYIQRRFAEAA